MASNQKQQFLWLALLATIIWSALMGLEVAGYHRQNCSSLQVDRGVSSRFASPIGALTMTADAAQFQALIDQCDSSGNRLWNVHVAQTNTCMDFLFIALYGGVFLLLASVLGGWLAIWVRVTIVLTMLMDVGENVGLLFSLHAIEDSSGAFHPSVVFSSLKWILFALSLFLLAGLFAKAAEIRRLGKAVMAAALVLSGLAVIGGLFYLPLLTLAILLLGVGLVVALLLFFPIQPFSVGQLLLWVPLLYLLRFQIVAGMLLSVVLPILYFEAPSVFIGIFDALGLKSFIVVIWAGLQLAWTVMITSRMIFVYGPDRYAVLGELDRAKSAEAVSSGSLQDDRLSWPAVGCFGMLALPSIVMTISDTPSIHWWEKIIGTLIGVGLSVLVLWVTAKLHIWIEPGPGRTASQLYPDFGLLKADEPVGRSGAGKLIDRIADRILPPSLTAGILDADGRLRSGHQLAATAFAVLLLIYLISGIAFSPNSILNPPAAIFFLLFLLSLLTWTFSGLAFFLDVLRVPVLTFTLALSLVFGSVGTDHTFKGDNLADVAPSPAEVVRAWKSTRGKEANAPIIVVATAGGGIRASSWTAEVLTRIAGDCRQGDGSNSFSSSLVLVSSVSGGSEGTMYVVGSYDGAGHLLDDDTNLKYIRDDSSQTALSAVGWGVLYPDLLRSIPLVGSVSGELFLHDLDRGWALENQWIRNWTHPLWSKDPNHPVWSEAPKMNGWIDDTKKGMRPAVLFNSTVSETGQRLIIGSSGLPAGSDANVEWGSTALQFARAYPDLDIHVSTAARLSASFSWVSPMSRTEKDFLHFADGGYFDNSGLLSVSDWLLAAGEEIKDRPVILILIDSSDSEPSAPKAWSWQRQFIAPVSTLNSVRSGSQQSRSDFELPLLVSYLTRQKGIGITKYRFLYPKDRLAPLSWHLTPEQQRSIGEAWSNADSQLAADRAGLYGKLGCHLRNE
jgi:hypothetical protein